jgi:hypothetical protein
VNERLFCFVRKAEKLSPKVRFAYAVLLLMVATAERDGERVRTFAGHPRRPPQRAMSGITGFFQAYSAGLLFEPI